MLAYSPVNGSGSHQGFRLRALEVVRRQKKKQREDNKNNIKEWTGLELAKRKRRRELVAVSSVVPQRSVWLTGTTEVK